MKPISLFIFIISLPLILFSQIHHWETAVYADSLWKYRLGSSEPSSSWRSVSFDDSLWFVGQGSIGYGDGDDNTIISQTESLYMRRKFLVTDKSKISEAIFHADYDDGFVAYLNGFEIVRANLDGNPPAHNAWTPALREAQMYQGGNPVSFTVDNSNLQQILNNGENVLSVQTHNYEGLISSDMTTLYWLSFGINDSSYDYGPTPSWFINETFQTHLPIVKINTWGQVIPDEPSIQAEMGIIWDSTGNPNFSSSSPNEFLGNISIELRGQTSLELFPKKNYSIETKDSLWEDMDVSFLNFPEEEDWILHGPYSDKTLIRNVLAMELARKMRQYASRTRLVELMVNNNYQGVYVLMERIKRDKNRVDIATLRPEDISGDELTGGYVIKLDKGPIDWYSQYDMVNNPGEKLRFQYVSPSRTKIQPEQEAYIQSYIDSFENAMIVPGFPFGGKTYDEFIDIESFADHFIISELTKNVDAYRISTYMYKDKDSNGGLLKAGPIWDFNLAFGNADYCNSFTDHSWVYDEHCGIFNPFWWDNMFIDDLFVNTVRCRYEDFRAGPLALDSIISFIDEKAALLAPVVDRNFQRWPVLGEYVWPNPVTPNTYQGEINNLKTFITNRINWLDQNMLGTCAVSLDEELENSFHVKIYPNPTSGRFYVETGDEYTRKLEVKLLDITGREIPVEIRHLRDNHLYEIEPLQYRFNQGVYFLVLMNENVVASYKVQIK